MRDRGDRGGIGVTGEGWARDRGDRGRRAEELVDRSPISPVPTPPVPLSPPCPCPPRARTCHDDALELDDVGVVKRADVLRLLEELDGLVPVLPQHLLDCHRLSPRASAGLLAQPGLARLVQHRLHHLAKGALSDKTGFVLLKAYSPANRTGLLQNMHIT